MEISEIAPILKAEKATPAFSAEKNGKMRVTYPRWNIANAVPLGHRIRGDSIDDPDPGGGSP